MKRLIFVVVMVAAIPVVAWLAGTGVESHLRKQFSDQVEKQFGDRGLAAMASGKLSLDRFCSESQASGEAVCRTFRNVFILKTGSLCALLAGITLVVGISLAARFASLSRTLLLKIFTPGMKVVLFVLFALILIQGAIATYGAYIFEATMIHRVHFILIGGIGLGALLGAGAMIKEGLSISRPASTSVIGKQIPANAEPQLWKFVKDIATRLSAIPPKNIVIGLEPNFYVTAAEVVVQPESRHLAGETLYLSLPLMRILTREELTAVLGHELGHFKGEDTEFSLKFYPIYVGTAQALIALKNPAHEGVRSLALLPASVVLSFFMEQFAQAERTIGRQRELEADKAGAAASSGHALATSLLKIGAFSPIWDWIRSAMIEALKQGKVYQNVSALFSEIATDACSKPDIFDHTLSSATAHPTDTHPPTNVRIEALGLSVTELRNHTLTIDPQSSSATLVSKSDQIEEELTAVFHQLLVAIGAARMPEGRESES